jgi:hypothetical protein
VAADRLDGAGGAGGTGNALFVLRASLLPRPGQTARLRYAYGLTHGARVASLVARLRAQPDPAATSAPRWAAWLPKADFGAGRRHVARELAWDAYLLRSASVYEEECGHHAVTQGGYYQYGLGANLGSRSWLHYALPLVHTSPNLAREILRYTISQQSRDPRKPNQLPYGTGPLCTRSDLGTSSDLDFWLLLAAGEYGLGARHPRFFDEPLPFEDGGARASAWEHVKIAFRHQESLRGPRGGYLAGEAGDWSDFSSEYLGTTESLLVPAQLAYAYPSSVSRSRGRCSPASPAPSARGGWWRTCGASSPGSALPPGPAGQAASGRPSHLRPMTPASPTRARRPGRWARSGRCWAPRSSRAVAGSTSTAG